MENQENWALPTSPFIVPMGLSRKESAAYIGVGVTKFDEMTNDGRMPLPRIIDSRKVWERYELEEAFRNLPRNDNISSISEWDEALIPC